MHNSLQLQVRNNKHSNLTYHCTLFRKMLHPNISLTLTC